jgi:branched-chain amino acid transport system ATP-binding protein
VFGSLTVEENLQVGANTVPDGRVRTSRLKEVYELFPRLGERRRQEGATLSGGEQQMLAIGRALMAGPRLLMLDEPSLGLSPVLVGNVFRTIADIRESGTTVLLVEQNSRMALRHSDAGYVLEVGRVVLSGPSTELQSDDNVRRVYLGQELLPSEEKGLQR